MTRVGLISGDSAANLLPITRTCHAPLPSAGMRSTSGGVLFSFPGQNGQFSTCCGAVLGTRRETSSSGRLARSVAMMTHSFVK